MILFIYVSHIMLFYNWLQVAHFNRRNSLTTKPHTWSLKTAHVDGGPSTRSSLSALQLLFQTLQLKEQGAFFCSQSLQHRLLLDQRLRQLVETILQLGLAAAAESLVGQLEEHHQYLFVKLTMLLPAIRQTLSKP